MKIYENNSQRHFLKHLAYFEEDKSNLGIGCLEHHSISSLAEHFLLQVPINDQLRRVAGIIVASSSGHSVSDLAPQLVPVIRFVQAVASIGDAQLASMLSFGEKVTKRGKLAEESSGELAAGRDGRVV